jgi:hypothetical protein
MADPVTRGADMPELQDAPMFLCKPTLKPFRCGRACTVSFLILLEIPSLRLGTWAPSASEGGVLRADKVGRPCLLLAVAGGKAKLRRMRPSDGFATPL